MTEVFFFVLKSTYLSSVVSDEGDSSIDAEVALVRTFFLLVSGANYPPPSLVRWAEWFEEAVRSTSSFFATKPNLFFSTAWTS